MKEGFVVNDRLVGRVIETKLGEKVDVIFPHKTQFIFDENTIIADVRKTSRNYNYKVLSFLEGRIVSSFDCNEVTKLDNDNYKLKLREDSEGIERSLIYNPKIGKAVSKVYDSMSELSGDGTFLCTINVNKRMCKFDYILKIDPNGEVVSDVLNTYTEEVIPYNELINDENNTINLITEKSRKNFVKGYELSRKIM